MSIVMYLVLWVTIGAFTGLIAHWMSDAAVWPWFFVCVAAGILGAVLGGYFVSYLFSGIETVLSAFSLVLSLAGAVLAVFLVWFMQRGR